MTKHRDLPEKERLQHRQQVVYRKAMPYPRPPAQALEIPCKGSSFAAYLRLPLRRQYAACFLSARLATRQFRKEVIP
jgi:hypothetical protein